MNKLWTSHEQVMIKFWKSHEQVVNKLWRRGLQADLEKAASGASGACGHFVENPAILRTFWVENPAFLTEDGGRIVEDESRSIEVGWWWK